MLKKELLAKSNECLKSKQLSYDVSCDTGDLCLSYGKRNFVEVICDKDGNKFTNLDKSDNEKNVGFKIMKRRGYKCQWLGKHEQGIRKPIQKKEWPNYIIKTLGIT